MSTPTTAAIDYRLRRFFLGLSALICAVTIVELLLLEHTQGLAQLIPFGLSGLGIVAVVAAMARPTRQMILVLRGLMGLIIAGSIFGIYEHLEGNWEFALELHAGSGMIELLLKTLAGANPLIAPGTLAIAGIIAVAATYYHPSLGGKL